MTHAPYIDHLVRQQIRFAKAIAKKLGVSPNAVFDAAERTRGMSLGSIHAAVMIDRMTIVDGQFKEMINEFESGPVHIYKMPDSLPDWDNLIK